MNYLELCQALVSELGIGGGTGPSSVTGQTGKLALAVRWIQAADLWLNVKWVNWKYLSCDYLEMVQAGVQVPPAASTPSGVKVKQWNRSAFYLNKFTGNASQLTWVPWPQFRAHYHVGVQLMGKSAVITNRDDNSLLLQRPADVTYSIHGEFWRRPPVLAQDTDTPAMPEDFHRVIIARAAVFYGNKEAAAEVISAFEAEFIDLIGKLESNQLDGFENDTMSTQDVDYAMSLPGEVR